MEALHIPSSSPALSLICQQSPFSLKTPWNGDAGSCLMPSLKHAVGARVRVPTSGASPSPAGRQRHAPRRLLSPQPITADGFSQHHGLFPLFYLRISKISPKKALPAPPPAPRGCLIPRYTTLLGRSYVGRRGFSSELTTALAAAQQNMSSLHKQRAELPCVWAARSHPGLGGGTERLSFFPIKQPKPWWWW